MVEEIKEEAIAASETKGKIYNFFYPDKDLLPEDKEMSLFDHLEELRERLFISILAVGAAVMGCFIYSKELIMLLEAPVSSQGVRFLQLAPGEFFFTTIKVSINSLIYSLCTLRTNINLMKSRRLICV